MILSDIQFALGNLVAAHDSELARRATRLTTLCRLFLECYGDGPISLMRAPARMGLLGEHIDYVSYLPTASLTFASHERDALMLYRRSNEPVVHCVSSSASYEPEMFSILGADIPEFEGDVETEWLGFLAALGTPKPNWKNYLMSSVAFARGQFGRQILSGFDLALDSNIPPGGGASSSSALVVLGGAGTRFGAMIGGFLYTLLDQRLGALSGSSRVQDLPDVLRVPLSEPLFLLGTLFILLVFFVPGGIASLPARLRGMRPRREPLPEEAAV